ncbi:hypothetical protein [Yersinia phage vB_YenM_P778]
MAVNIVHEKSGDIVTCKGCNGERYYIWSQGKFVNKYCCVKCASRFVYTDPKQYIHKEVK